MNYVWSFLLGDICAISQIFMDKFKPIPYIFGFYGFPW